MISMLSTQSVSGSATIIKFLNCNSNRIHQHIDEFGQGFQGHPVDAQRFHRSVERQRYRDIRIIRKQEQQHARAPR